MRNRADTLVIVSKLLLVVPAFSLAVFLVAGIHLIHPVFAAFLFYVGLTGWGMAVINRKRRREEDE